MTINEIVLTPSFEKDIKKLVKKYKTIALDIEKFQNELLENPEIGDDLGNGFRKIRMAIRAKGKGKTKLL